LEHKCKSKDQLFEDSLASTTTGVCGSSGAEYTNLISKLKKRVLKLRARLTQSDKEIIRLTKTVKVVEIEVKEDNEPLHLELANLKRRNSELEFELANRKPHVEHVHDNSEE
jgi:predicted RNase H-like nuclease (RuvC/YqgF family)